VVGSALALLVGTATGPRARRAAVVTGVGVHMLTGLVMVVVLARVGFGSLLWLVVMSAVSGVLAGWRHDRLARRPRLDDCYAT